MRAPLILRLLHTVVTFAAGYATLTAAWYLFGLTIGAAGEESVIRVPLAPTDAASAAADALGVEGRFASVEMLATGLDPWTIVALQLPVLVQPACWALLLWTGRSLIAGIATGELFRRSIVRWLAASAIMIGLGLTVVIFAGRFADAVASNELLNASGLHGWSGTSNLEWTTIAIGVALGVLALAFAAGGRMQAENARLRQDTEGLV